MPDDKDDNLSPEERKVDDILATYEAEIAAVDKQLDAIKDPRRTPKYTPAFFRGGFTPKDETKLGLEARKEDLVKQAKGRVAEIADQSPPALQGKLYEKADAWRNLPKEGDEKTLDQSSGFLSRLRERSQFTKGQREFDATKEKAGAPFAENKHDVAAGQSSYYSHLRFNTTDNPRMPDTDREASAPVPDRED